MVGLKLKVLLLLLLFFFVGFEFVEANRVKSHGEYGNWFRMRIKMWRNWNWTDPFDYFFWNGEFEWRIEEEKRDNVNLSSSSASALCPFGIMTQSHNLPLDLMLKKSTFGAMFGSAAKAMYCLQIKKRKKRKIVTFLCII